MNDTIIINKALDRLNIQTGLLGNWEPMDKEVDGQIDFQLDANNLQVFAEVKKELREHQLPKLIEMAATHRPFMVVADRIFPNLKAMLREQKIGYLDTAGNIYLNADGNFIWLDGNKHLPEEKTPTNRAFTKTGLKTVFYLLLHEEAINMPHRKLADITNVALGNIKNVIDGLKDAGFILMVNDKTMKLQNKKALLDRWIAGYRETLKPILLLGKFRFFNNEQLPDLTTQLKPNGDTVLGGELGAAHLTNYLRPQVYTIYTTEQKGALMVKWKLVPDDTGNVLLYKKFWKDGQANNNAYAPTLLIYADLLLTNDPRCIETADIIYNQYLKDAFE